jgi:hypothetical protein
VNEAVSSNTTPRVLLAQAGKSFIKTYTSVQLIRLSSGRWSLIAVREILNGLALKQNKLRK